MEQIKVLIVEDEWIVSEEIKELLIQHGYDVIGQAEEAEEAMNKVNEFVPDIVLMDINIEGQLDGIELARRIVSKHKSAIIFLTAYYDDYFIKRAKAIKPAAYIVKPFDEKNLLAAIEIAFSNLEGERSDLGKKQDYKVDDRIFVKTQSEFKKLYIKSILYVEAVGSYIDIHTLDGKHTLAINLKTFEERLSDKRFFRVHRSYLINTEVIESFNGNTIEINNHLIPISANRKIEFLNMYKLI